MRYLLHADIEICGVSPDLSDNEKESIVDDFLKKFIALFGSEQAATDAVRYAVMGELDVGELLIDDQPYCVYPPETDTINNQYFTACEYAFRDWQLGQPDEISITLGIGVER